MFLVSNENYETLSIYIFGRFGLVANFGPMFFDIISFMVTFWVFQSIDTMLMSKT